MHFLKAIRRMTHGNYALALNRLTAARIAHPVPGCWEFRRRAFGGQTFAASLLATMPGGRVQAQAQHPDARWYERAARMRTLAVTSGDQPYGAAIVLDGRLLAEAPSRVVGTANSDAHAEREAVREAQRVLGRSDLSGSVLYSTSRPCAVCESAAAEARVARMYFGESMSDAGPPRSAR